MSMITDFRQVIRYWWIFIFLGTILAAFGLSIMAFPVASFRALSIFFEIAIFVNGVLEISFALSNYRRVPGWGWHFSGGLLELAIAGLLLFNPALAAASLSLFVGFWLMFRSISIIGRCFDLPTIWPEKAWMLLLGLAGLVFSFFILYNPQFGTWTLDLWAALALISIGLFYFFLGVHLKNNPG
ncbi:MAG TPA: DUF308 domain-containing protein [Puia sp.]|nr:DUF308 domain-containing protein [Puia sp.]